MMRTLLVLPGLALLVVAVSCGGSSKSSSQSQPPTSGNGQVDLTSIKINPATASIAPGTTQAFSATGSYSDGSTKDITTQVQWACPGTNSATVSNTAPTQGLVLASQPGGVVVTASLSGISENAVLTVNNVSVSTLTISPSTPPTLGWDNPLQFTATATFSDKSQQDVTNVTSWSMFPGFITSNTGFAIGQLFFGETSGSSMVNAIFGFQSATATVNIDFSNLVSIAVMPGSASMANGTKLQMSAVGTFMDGSTRDVSSLVFWSSSNGGAANFISSTAGLLTASGAGQTTISATLGTTTGSTPINVTPATLVTILVVPGNATIAPNTKLSLRAYGVFTDSTVQDITSQMMWSSLNPIAASVNSEGTLSGLSQGTTTINVSAPSALGSIQGTTQVNVTSATLDSVALTPANSFIAPGASLSFAVTGTFSDGTMQDLTNGSVMSSNVTSVATVKSGVATGQGLGQATITANVGGVKGTTPLSVASAKQIAITTASSSAQIAQNTSVQLAMQGSINSGAAQDISTLANWTSSSPSIATVGWQTGIVTALTPGQTTITATLGSASTAIQVTVTNATLTSIAVSPSDASIALGTSQQFTAQGTFSDSSTEMLVGANWSSSMPGIAIVDGLGVAHSIGSGVTQITATVNGVSGSVNLTVH